MTHHDDARFDDLVAQLGDGNSKDLFRRLLERGMQQLIDAELTATIGAEFHERTDTRTNQRNGALERTLSTPAGDTHFAPDTTPSSQGKEQSPIPGRFTITLALGRPALEDPAARAALVDLHLWKCAASASLDFHRVHRLAEEPRKPARRGLHRCERAARGATLAPWSFPPPTPHPTPPPEEMV